MHLVFTLPDATGDQPATDRQATAVLMFYEQDFGGVTFDQADSLLSCRDFARRSADTIFNRYPEPLRHLMARSIAAFLLSDGQTLQFVRNWSKAACERGSGSPRVHGAPFFSEVTAFANYLEGMMEMEGWTADAIKRLR